MKSSLCDKHQNYPRETKSTKKKEQNKFAVTKKINAHLFGFTKTYSRIYLLILFFHCWQEKKKHFPQTKVIAPVLISCMENIHTTYRRHECWILLFPSNWSRQHVHKLEWSKCSKQMLRLWIPLTSTASPFSENVILKTNFSEWNII